MSIDPIPPTFPPVMPPDGEEHALDLFEKQRALIASLRSKNDRLGAEAHRLASLLEAALEYNARLYKGVLDLTKELSDIKSAAAVAALEIPPTAGASDSATNP